MAISLRRGFISDSERIADDVWDEHGATPLRPLSPFRLAASLDIPILRITDLVGYDSEAVSWFSGFGSDHLSAYTVFDEMDSRVVYVNTFHSVGRQRNSVGHEVAHAILMHPPAPPLTSDGKRHHDKLIELEAETLAGVLLIPKRAAIYAALQGWSDSEAAEHFSVSEQLARWRLGTSGARLIAKRRNAGRGRIA